jgi:hypothetical protein
MIGTLAVILDHELILGIEASHGRATGEKALGMPMSANRPKFLE